MLTQIFSVLLLTLSAFIAWHVYRRCQRNQAYRKEEKRLQAEAREERRIELDRQHAINEWHRTTTHALQAAIMRDHHYTVRPDGTLIVAHPARPQVQVTEVAQQQQQIAAPLFVDMPTAPAFRQIASQVAPGHLILGYSSHGPVWGDVTDLLSTAIVGRPDTGKTTMLRLVCAQILQIGGLPLLLDPHGSIMDELGDSINCAESGQEITELTDWVAGELDTRLMERRQGLPLKQPLLVLGDEWPIISQIAPDALQPVRRLVLEGRKVGMYALICGQGLPAQLLGGTLVRDALASRYIFNTTAQQARLAGLDNDTAKTMLARLEDAGRGKAILASAKRRPELVAIPNTETRDLRMIVEGTLADERKMERPANVQTFPQSAVRQPEKPTDTTSGERLGKYLLSNEEIDRFIAAYKACTNIDKALASIGKGSNYRESARRVIEVYGLRKEA